MLVWRTDYHIGGTESTPDALRRRRTHLCSLYRIWDKKTPGRPLSGDTPYEEGYCNHSILIIGKSSPKLNPYAKVLGLRYAGLGGQYTVNYKRLKNPRAGIPGFVNFSSVGAYEFMMQTAANSVRETDEELMARFQAGDAAAMELLFARFQKPLFNYFYRMVRRRETAEDLVQDTFVKLCRFGHTFCGDNAKFTTWLYSVAGNQCRDYLRHSSRRPETPVADIERNSEEEDIFGDSGDSPVEDEILRAELRTALKTAISHLPEKERTAIVLREYQGLEYKEIAEVLGCPIGSVKVLIFRARQRLRERLSDLTY